MTKVLEIPYGSSDTWHLALSGFGRTGLWCNSRSKYIALWSQRQTTPVQVFCKNYMSKPSKWTLAQKPIVVRLTLSFLLSFCYRFGPYTWTGLLLSNTGLYLTSKTARLAASRSYSVWIGIWNAQIFQIPYESQDLEGSYEKLDFLDLRKKGKTFGFHMAAWLLGVHMKSLDLWNLWWQARISSVRIGSCGLWNFIIWSLKCF